MALMNGEKQKLFQTLKKSVKQKLDGVMNTIKRGDLFGEVSLIYGCNRSATVHSI